MTADAMCVCVFVQNAQAQNGWLKHELGFQGYIMSDWAATHSGVDSALNGLDMTM
jgi:beta-glucosidase